MSYRLRRFAGLIGLFVVALSLPAVGSNLRPNRVLTKGAAISGSKRLYTEFRYRPICVRANGAAAGGTAGDTNLLFFPGECLEMPSTLLEYHIKGTQTLVAPAFGANGLDIGLDQTSTDGVELSPGITARCPVAFTVGTDKDFFLEVTTKIEDVSGLQYTIGFRKAEAYQADDDDYNDMAAIGIVGTAGDIKLATILGNAATTTTDTTDDAADAAVLGLRVNVSSAGVVTYQRSLASGSALAAPTTTAAFTFANGTVLVPFIYCVNAADVAGTVELQKFDCGLR